MAGILSGIRILDLTRNVAGPYCTMILGDLGAEVIKIERPEGGDDTRHWHPPSWNGRSATFLGLNRNKKSMAVDLDREEGRQIISRLTYEVDVLVESFRHGSLERRGLGYEDVRAANPRIIYCSITGFGGRGAYRDRPGYDPVIQAYSGIMSITGEPDRPPVRVGPSIVDMGTGLWCTIGIIGALHRRERTGEGCRLQTSLLETALAWVSYQIAGYFGSGVVPRRSGSEVAMIAPYEAFATSDEYLFVAAPNDQIFARLCMVVGLPDLPFHEQYRTNYDRVTYRRELHTLLEERLKRESAHRWEERLLAHEIPCSRIRTLDEVVIDAQVQAMELFMAIPHPAITDLRLVDLPLTVNGARAAQREPPPDLGQHTDNLLRGLGYEEDRIQALRRTRVIA